jgi:branched-chain amino acid transport system substrate-binding protein
MVAWRAFMKKYIPDGATDINYVYGYGLAQTLIQVLKQCGNDLSRRNIMKQAASLSRFKVSVALPGIELTTTATDFRPISQLQLMRFNGKSFERLGKIMSGD